MHPLTATASQPRRTASRALRIAALAAASLTLLILCFQPPSARAAINLQGFDVTFTDDDEDGQMVTQAGAHPYAMTTSFTVPLKFDPIYGNIPQEATKDVFIAQIPGFIGDQTAVPKCSNADFLELVEGRPQVSECSDSTVVGRTVVTAGDGVTVFPFEAPVYNLDPPPGAAAKLGFHIQQVPVTVEVGLEESPPYSLVARSTNISQVLEFYGVELTLWGVPADPDHDEERGRCFDGSDTCPAGVEKAAFLTLPRACEGPLATRWDVSTWPEPGVFSSGSALTRDDASPPNPQGMTGCGKLGFAPRISASPTTRAAQSPSGLDFSLEMDNEGLGNPSGIADSDIRKAVVTLPEGMTANPSMAEGLEVCSEADLARETPSSPPGAGCPEASKIGTAEVETPITDELVHGALYVAEPYENPFGTLLALYFVAKSPTLGVIVREPIKVEPDPVTGQLVSTTREMIQVPISRVRLHLREGGRSPLISPRGCGSYDVEAELTPWSDPTRTVETNSAFTIVSGPGEGPCPPPGTPPFAPGFEAGTINNAAAAFSDFYMRLTRRDGDQDLTRFSAALPPGMVAKLAAVSQCPDAAIAAAKGKSGRAEQAAPSCPASSRIGRALAGAGAGSQLTYVPGSVYLAGPYHGAPLSVVAIVPAVAGPFDVGTVVTRQALRIDPRSAAVRVDGEASDPIPHILAGIPLNVRDIRVYVDRPQFTLNPTNCAPSQVGATLWGSGADVFNGADDFPLFLASRFQAADCASLGFRPKLAIKLQGGTKRGAFPGLKAVVTPRPGDANFRRATVTLPRSAFLEQGHIRTICTRVQFAAGPGNGAHCPPGSRYGFARAWTPILDAPAQGPVYLRSSDNNLPDLVVALKGPQSAPADVELSARIDSVRGGIRSTFTGVPDLPVSRFVLQMRGGSKGLIVNSRNLCFKPRRNRARANLIGQNGRRLGARPVVRASCGMKRAKRSRAAHRRNTGN